MLYFLQLQYIMRRLSGDTQAGTETCVALPLSSRFNLSQQRRILFTTRFRCVWCWDDQLQLHLLLTLARRWRWGKSGRRRPSLSDNMFADGEWIVPMQGLPGQGAAYPSVTARPCGFLSGVDRNCRQENSHTDIHQVHRLTVHLHQCDIFQILIE